MSRTLCWFSCGAASAVATKQVLEYGWPDVQVVYCDTGSEHSDNERFVSDCEKWFGQDVIRLRSDRYDSTWDVFLKTKYLVGPKGARCTTELKRNLRSKYQRPGDLHVFGFTTDERSRSEDFVRNYPDIDAEFPLISAGLTKGDCLTILKNVGIEIPMMYKLGYRNNNCIGCPKGGMGYWNKIRRDFPVEFNIMSGIERLLGRTVLREKGGSALYLDELSPERGNYSVEQEDECSFMCNIVTDMFNGSADQ